MTFRQMKESVLVFIKISMKRFHKRRNLSFFGLLFEITVQLGDTKV